MECYDINYLGHDDINYVNLWHVIVWIFDTRSVNSIYISDDFQLFLMHLVPVSCWPWYTLATKICIHNLQTNTYLSGGGVAIECCICTSNYNIQAAS